MKMLIGIGAALLLGATSASATISVGGFDFNDDAFADTLTASSGDFSTSGGSLADVLTDKDAGTYAFSFSEGAFVELGFTDNLVINGMGNDLVLFELGVADPLTVTIGGVTLEVLTAATGFSAGGFSLNAIALDLDLFGIADGGSISSLRLAFPINQESGTVSSTSLVGALNSQSITGGVPEPTTWAMLIAGFGLVGAAARRRRPLATAHA